MALERPPCLGQVTLWLLLANLLLVLARTLREILAALRIQKLQGSIFPHYVPGNIFTLLELFNLTCNFTGFTLRVLYAWSPNGRHFYTNILPLASTQNVATSVNLLDFNCYVYGASELRCLHPKRRTRPARRGLWPPHPQQRSSGWPSSRVQWAPAD